MGERKVKVGDRFRFMAAGTDDIPVPELVDGQVYQVVGFSDGYPSIGDVAGIEDYTISPWAPWWEFVGSSEED